MFIHNAFLTCLEVYKFFNEKEFLSYLLTDQTVKVCCTLHIVFFPIMC